MKTLLIIGAGGHGKVVADTALRSGWGKILFLDAVWPVTDAVAGWSIVGHDRDYARLLKKVDGVAVAIGENATRGALLEELKAAGAPLVTLIDPSAIVSDRTALGPGCVIFAGAVVNIDAQLGSGVIVNSGAVVEHDCQIGDCVHIAPGAVLGGGVVVGAMSFVGLGARVLPLISVADHVTVGAGAVVTDSVAAGKTVKGVPAR